MNESSPPRERRRFISGAGAVCAGLAVNGSGAAVLAGSLTAPAESSDKFDAAQFRACLNTSFLVQPLGRNLPAVAVTLVRVTPESFGTATPLKTDLAFSIDFVAKNDEFAQDTYAVTHPELGEFIAMLVPSADKRTLTGVFHRFS